MSGTALPVPLAWGNMFVWIWLEVLALGALILWTTNTAQVISGFYFRNKKVIRLSRKRAIVDWFPMNADIRELPSWPKIVLTLIRICITVAVAFSALGIEPAQRFTSSQPTTEVVVKTDANFTGRSFDADDPDSIQDFAASACEDVTTLSIVKFMAFISKSSFSCNDGDIVGQRTPLVEVIWDKDTVRRIAGGRNLMVNIAVGDRSAIVEGRSNETLVELQHSDGIPSFMFVSRKMLTNQTFGACSGRREYLVVANTPTAQIDFQNVAAALVICEPRSTVHLRNTDNMVFLSIHGANQQLTLARKVAESLLSIKRDQSQRAYEGEKMDITILSTPFNILILSLAIGNTLLLLVSFLLKKQFTKDMSVDIFSPFSMYKLGATMSWNNESKWNCLTSRDTILLGENEGKVSELPQLP